MAFLEKMKETFPDRSFAETIMNQPVSFVLDDSNVSLIVENPNEYCFHLHNPNQTSLVHICIDGDFIKDKREKYRGEDKSFKRPDSLIFSDHQILFLELKMSVGVESRNLSKELFDSIDQLENFFLYLIENLTADAFHTYFKQEYTHFRIGLKGSPSSRWQRNNEYKARKASFGGQTGWYDLDYSTSFTFQQF